MLGLAIRVEGRSRGGGGGVMARTLNNKKGEGDEHTYTHTCARMCGAFFSSYFFFFFGGG